MATPYVLMEDAVKNIKKLRMRERDPLVCLKKMGIDPCAPLVEERTRRPGEYPVATEKQMDYWRRKAFSH